MCGFVGAFDLRGRREFDRAVLERMARSLRHRGPDSSGLHLEPGFAVAANRLAIVDVEGGRQPLSSEDGQVWVAFNGELFEHQELRERLGVRGHRFRTRCDTEAWLHLWEEYGDGLWEHARGQFAVSLWDRRSRTLVLGRDRMGIAPLYYAEADGWLLWSSEIRGLLASGLVPARPNLRGLDVFFVFFASSPTESMLEGVRSLPPGCLLSARDGRWSLRRYWDLDFPDQGAERVEDDPAVLVGELEEVVRRAVELRLRGDRPVAGYLSGGLDSATALGFAARAEPGVAAAFTIALPEDERNEREPAAAIAAALGLDHRVLSMRPREIVDAFPALVDAAEMPVLDTSAACLLRLAELVHANGLRVVMSGEGADEALAGYHWFRRQQRLLAAPAPLRLLGRGVRSLALARVRGAGRGRPPYRALAGTRVAQQTMHDFLAEARQLVYSDATWARLDGFDPYSALDLPSDRIGRWHPLNRSLYFGYKVMLPGMLLHAKGDRVAMRSSVEARYPFLDDEFVRFCAALHPAYKLRGSTDKWPLRALARRELPAGIADRPKRMFQTSRASIFLGPERPPWVDQLLGPEALEASGYFDTRGVGRARERFAASRATSILSRTLENTLASVVATQLWHHQWIEPLCELGSHAR